jgi:U3 small nucleolar RNA-associated protein 14
MDTDLLAFVTGLDPKETVKVIHESGESAALEDGKKKRKAKKVSIQEQPTFTQGLEPTSMAGLADFASALGDDTGFAGLKRQLGSIATGDDVLRLGQDIASAKKSKKKAAALEQAVPLIEAPLPKFQQDKIIREAASMMANKELAKWQPIVQHNRQQKTLSFPLHGPEVTNVTVNSFSRPIVPKNDFERELQQKLEASGLGTEGDLKRFEELEMNKLSAAEVEARYAELAKKRSLLFFQERKQKHSAKIKSKKYRKIKSKEKAKIEAAVESKMTSEERRMKAELARVKERLTLKTRKSNKWAQEMLHRRHIEPNSRQEIIGQLRDKERLRQEIFGRASEYNSDDEDQEDEVSLLSDDENNNRLNEEFFESDEEDGGEDSEEGSGEEEEYVTDSEAAEEAEQDPDAIVGRRTFGNFDKNGNRKVEDEEFKAVSKRKEKKAKAPKATPALTHEALEAGRQSLFEVATDAKLTEQQEIIKKAFANDDLFAEFQAEKDAIVNADAPKTVDLTLPGWGTWAGHGVATPKNQTKVLLKRKENEGVAEKKRKDHGLKNVIINERQNKKAAHLLTVQKIPYPYKSKEEYERATIGRPLGPEWNATTTFRKKIQPRVQVKVGSIIDPIKFVKQPKHN